jgi:hypothetical protein
MTAALVDRPRFRLHRFGPTAFLFVLPGIVCLVLGVALASRMNGVDEFIYVGAVERLSDFLQRWPDTYYAVRFGYLLPEWLFERVFGSDVGYVLLRFVILGAIATTLRMRGALRTVPAAVGAIIVVTSPIILNVTFTTYPVSLGTSLIVLGAGLLATCSLGEGRSAIQALASGIALALAWNSHLAALPVCAVVMAVFAIDELVTGRRDRPFSRIGLAVSLAAGTLLTVVAGIVIYRWQFDMDNVYGPTLRQANQETNAVFLEDSSVNWLTWRFYLLVGPLSIVAGITTWRTEHNVTVRRALRRLSWMSGLSLILFAWFEWAEHNPLLSIFWYSCMPLGIAVLTLGCAVAARANRLDAPEQVRFGVALCLVTFVVLKFTSVVRPPYAIVLAVGCAAAIAAIVGRVHSPRKAFGLLSIVPVIAAWLTVASPHDFANATSNFRVDPFYDRVLFAYNLDGINQVRLARDFAQALPQLPENRGEIRVWFDSAGPMNQVISTLVWYRSALQRETDPPMPAVGQVVTDRVLLDRPRYIVVLDESAADVELGVDEIRKLGPYSIVWDKHFEHGQWVANATLLERTDGAWKDYPCLGPAGNSVLCEP